MVPGNEQHGIPFLTGLRFPQFDGAVTGNPLQWKRNLSSGKTGQTLSSCIMDSGSEMRGESEDGSQVGSGLGPYCLAGICAGCPPPNSLVPSPVGARRASDVTCIETQKVYYDFLLWL